MHFNNKIRILHLGKKEELCNAISSGIPFPHIYISTLIHPYA